MNPLNRTDQKLLKEIREILKDDFLMIRKTNDPLSQEQPKDVIGLLLQINEKLDNVLKN